MIVRILSLLKMIWARPSIQTSIWLILESIFIWLADRVIVLLGIKKKKNKKLSKKAKKKKISKDEHVSVGKPKKRKVKRSKK